MSNKEDGLVENIKPKSRNLLILVVALWVGIFIGAAVFVVLILNGTISLGSSSQSNYAPLANLENGSLANDFELVNLDGTKTRLSDLRGKVVVVNFWATWCGPCVEEMPMFDFYAAQYPEFTMLGIDQGENAEKVGPFIKELGTTYPILLDQNSKVTESYRVSMLPTTYFIDEQGMIRFRHYGIMSQDQLSYYLKTLGAMQ
jgi:cytochrome c biogenesis protein CcmG/thiol:disulfide interchange protein DsbE